MKNKVLVFCCLIALFVFAQSATLFAQESDVPTAVQNTFDEMFPEATDVNWEQEEEEYLATFETSAYNLEVTFLEDGTWKLTVTYIGEEDLPTPAVAYIKKEFEVETYNSILKRETPGDVKYFTSFETEKQYVSLQFDEDGELLEKELEDL